MPDIHVPAPTATADLPADLIQLAAAIGELPTPAKLTIELHYQKVVESVRRRRRILGLVQEALSQLRLDIKYLMFDLEATRRERDAAQARLEELTGGADGSDLG